jgi:hypothetical protein
MKELLKTVMSATVPAFVFAGSAAVVASEAVSQAASQPATAASRAATTQPPAQAATHPSLSTPQDEYEGQTIDIAGTRR